VVDWSINVGHFLTMFVIVAGGAGFVYALRGRLDVVSSRLLNVEEDLKQLVQVLVKQGRQDERIDAMDQRSVSQGKRIDDLTTRVNILVDSAVKKSIVSGEIFRGPS